MGKVWRDIQVPIPSRARLSRSNMQVYDPVSGPDRGLLIGYAINETTMHPNTWYFRLHRNDWNALHPEAPLSRSRYILTAGLYALVLGAAQKEGLYETLTTVCGLQNANRLMDSALVLLSEEEYPDSREEWDLSSELTFTGYPLDEQRWSDLLPNPIPEAQVRKVLDGWLRHCLENGLQSVWLVLNSQQSAWEPEPDEEDRRRIRPAMALPWAVQANGDRAGLPVACFPDKAGVIDAQVLQELCGYFTACGVSVQGVLCDSAFCDPLFLHLLAGTGLPYAVFLKRDNAGFQAMLREYGPGIQVFDNYTSGVYAHAGEAELFDGSGLALPSVLIFDLIRAARGQVALASRLWQAKREIEEAIREGRGAFVPEGLEKYLRFEGIGEDLKVEVRNEAYLEDYLQDGYSVLAASEKKSTKEAALLWNWQNVFRLPSAELNPPDNSNAHGSPAEKTRMVLFPSFLAAVLNWRIQQTCTDLKLIPESVLQEAENVRYLQFGEAYRLDEKASKDMKKLLNALGITAAMLKEFAPEVTRRCQHHEINPHAGEDINILPWTDPVRKSPRQSKAAPAPSQGVAAPAPSSDNPPDTPSSDPSSISADNPPVEAAPKPKHPGGRPKGSKNRKTLAREAEEQALREAEGYVEPEKSKGGRPKGRKDSYQRTRSTKRQMEEKRKTKEQGAES